MAFSPDDFQALVRMIEDHPEWRADLRRLLLTNELLLLPEQMAQFRAQTDLQFQELRTALDRLTEQVQKLTNAQQRTDARLEALADAQQRTEARVEALAEAQQRTEVRLEALAEAQQHTEVRLQALVGAQQRTENQIFKLSQEMTDLTQVARTLVDDVGGLKGMSLEHEYRTKVFAYFSRILNRPHVVGPEELTTLLADAVDIGVLSETQAHEISLADIVVRGKRGKGGPEVYLVVEVSWGVGEKDVERAVQRAALLAQLGTPVMPVVAGRWVTADAERFAHAQHVWQLRNGATIPPEPPSEA